MSVASQISLDAIERGEYSTPAEAVSVKVINGPWPWPAQGKKMFRRNKGESIEAWRKKVLDSLGVARTCMVRSPLRTPTHVSCPPLNRELRTRRQRRSSRL